MLNIHYVSRCDDVPRILHYVMIRVVENIIRDMPDFFSSLSEDDGGLV